MAKPGKDPVPLALEATLLVAALAATIYAACYYALVERSTFFVQSQAPARIVAVAFPQYRMGGDTANQVFRPMHAIDRHMRPEFWPTAGDTDTQHVFSQVDGR